MGRMAPGEVWGEGDGEAPAQSFPGNGNRKRPHLKVAKYWQFRQEEWDVAFSDGKVAAISLAAIDDDKKADVCTLHCASLVAENDHFPHLPSKFERLLAHPAV